ncbi:MAG: hypothetical protein Q7R65_00960 [bacterium]|jgi:hypothetical protein|nr:hypothetical protein [bacterium]
MNEKINKQTEETISNFFETKYFEALSELIAEELEITKTWLLNKGLPNDDLRYYQGRAEGLGVILLRIKTIHDEHMKTQT